ncbi:MAG: HpcH/HpaI aldolase/citrate lyase family protein [Candidatus Cloacimonetes bacterium]|nr:HpcH/HpaI aldolase/citrate lyase family protein [Candidatus Cloacimonadota bacterium]
MKNRLRRTRLYMPGNNPNLLQNIGVFSADTVILDLEDAVAPSEKDAARILVKYALKNVNFGNSEKGVRINPLDTPFGKEDAEMAVQARAEIIFLPKTEDIESVLELANIIGKKEIWISPIIETAKGVLNANEIASASSKVVMICFGAEDFTRDIGAERTKEGKELFWARSMIVMAAKANGIQASDTVFSNVDDIESLEKETIFIKSLGFDGKGVIHPGQIEPINKVFKPTEEEIDYAKKVLEALETAKKQGKGTASLGRKMIDKPVADRARRIIRMSVERKAGSVERRA